MSDVNLVNPKEYDTDLHDIYASFMGYFERKAIPWYNHSYASYFNTFNDFLSFGWGAIVVTDRRTGKGHVVVKGGSGGGGGANGGSGGSGFAGGGAVGQFARMIKTRFGESLPKLPNQLPLDPYESKPRLLRHLNDLSSYKRLAATVPAAELAALKKKVRGGDVVEISRLWNSRNHSFLALEVTWWDKGHGVILEAGLCGCRCRNIDAMDSWPPIPDENYRRSHYVVSDWLDKRTNTNHHMPSQPRAFAHGESQGVSMGSLEKILNASINALTSPETDHTPNTLILLTIGDTSRLSDLKNVVFPNNVLTIDIANLERSLYRASVSSSSSPAGTSTPSAAHEPGHQHRSSRSSAPPSAPPQVRSSTTPLPLQGILNQLSIPTPPQIPISNSGNAAFYALLAFQMLVDRSASIPPVLKLHPTIYPYTQIYPPTSFQPPQLGYASPRGSATNLRMGESPGRRTVPLPPATRRAQTMYWDEAGAEEVTAGMRGMAVGEGGQREGLSMGRKKGSGNGNGNGGHAQELGGRSGGEKRRSVGER